MKWPIKTIGVLLLVGLFAQPTFALFQQQNSSTMSHAQALDTNKTNTNSNNLVKKEAANADDSIPFMKEEGQNPTEQVTGFGLLLRTLGALIVILGLLVAGTWFIRRSSGLKYPGDGKTPITVLSTTNIGEKQSLSVVKFGNKTLLVGATSQSIKVLATEKCQDEEIPEEIIENAYSVKDLLNATELAEQHKILKY